MKASYVPEMLQMSKGSRGTIERALKDKYWRQDEGFQAEFQAISEPENQRTASEDVRRVGPPRCSG